MVIVVIVLGIFAIGLAMFIAAFMRSRVSSQGSTIQSQPSFQVELAHMPAVAPLPDGVVDIPLAAAYIPGEARHLAAAPYSQSGALGTVTGVPV